MKIWLYETLKRIEGKIDSIQEGIKKMALTLDDLIADEAAVKAELATLGGLVTQIISAVASGSLDQTKAAALDASLKADGTTVQGAITAITAALPTPPVTTGP